MEDAANKLRVKVERYQSWEDANSDAKPTIKQLRRIANQFKRPVSVFYLAEPPEGFMPMRDFRRLPGDGIQHYSPALLYEMELAQQRRELSLELYRDFGDEIPEFTETARLTDNPEEVGQRIREMLGITFDEQVAWRQGDRLGPFKAWRSAIEALGILVFQMNRVDPDEVSGVAVAEYPLPIIAVNRKDVPNRRTFSLLHELAHILLRLSGASDLTVDDHRPPEEQEVEVFCNRAAASALMPEDIFLDMPAIRAQNRHSEQWEDRDILTLSRQFGVSPEALVRRLLTFGRTTQRFYEHKRQQYSDEYQREMERRRVALKQSDKKFSRNPPVDTFVELGRPFVRLILDSVKSDFITLNEASGYLGNLRIRHFSNLEERVYTG